jgi:hypothetical protein
MLNYNYFTFFFCFGVKFLYFSLWGGGDQHKLRCLGKCTQYFVTGFPGCDTKWK